MSVLGLSSSICAESIQPSSSNYKVLVMSDMHITNKAGVDGK